MNFRNWLLVNEATKVKVHLPEVKQHTGYSCGAASLQAIFRYYGVAKSEREMIRLLKSNPQDGTRTANLIRVAQRFGFRTEARHNADVGDLKRWLGEKKPVIVVLQSKGTEKQYRELKNGHYLALIGHDRGSFYFEDPSLRTSARGKIPFKEFERRWKDEDGDGDLRYRWALAVWKDQPPAHQEAARTVKKI